MRDIPGIEAKFRRNVAAIIENDGGDILIGERLDTADAWQFPQGGVDADESPEEALVRELDEELSLAPGNYRVLESRGPYRYLLAAGRTKQGFHGQEQTYFRVRLTAPESCIEVATAHPEFRRVRWVRPEAFRLEWLPETKREVYGAVFRDFFGVVLTGSEKFR